VKIKKREGTHCTSQQNTRKRNRRHLQKSTGNRQDKKKVVRPKRRVQKRLSKKKAVGERRPKKGEHFFMRAGEEGPLVGKQSQQKKMPKRKEVSSKAYEGFIYFGGTSKESENSFCFANIMPEGRSPLAEKNTPTFLKSKKFLKKSQEKKEERKLLKRDGP